MEVTFCKMDSINLGKLGCKCQDDASETTVRWLHAALSLLFAMCPFCCHSSAKMAFIFRSFCTFCCHIFPLSFVHSHSHIVTLPSKFSDSIIIILKFYKLLNKFLNVLIREKGKSYDSQTDAVKKRHQIYLMNNII